MRWDEIQEERCSIARTLSVIGDRWTMLVLRDAFLRIRKFDDFQKDLGISRQRLSDRLKKMVEEGVMEKVEYQINPSRYEYRLTQKGVDLYPIIVSMVTWGDKYMDNGDGAPIVYKHKACGNYFTAEIMCSECGDSVDPRDVLPEIGPGEANIRIPDK